MATEATNVANVAGAPAGATTGTRPPVIVEAHDVSKVYRAGDVDVYALQNANLSIVRGEFVSIVGPSGAGKSTLLHLLGGLDQPTSGRVILDGTDLTTLSEHQLTLFRRQATGFVFQFFNLLPTLNVRENIALPFIIRERNKKEHWERVDDLVELFGLRGKDTRPVTQLSTGEQQRVALAKALLTEPALLIADEPTGNLDTATGLELLQLLWESCDNQGQTVLLVTHHPRVAAYADRVLFLQDGAIIDELILGRREDHHDARPIIDRLEEYGL
jgi:putative ABC transport system ATP-binding protein